MIPQAAIVNLYSPGDTLSMHRDVSEECDKGLVSLSMGCDGIFVIGLDKGDGGFGDCLDGPAQQIPSPNYAVIRLRSGDAVYMSGQARFAWHGVPKIISGSCPSFLTDWPADQGQEESGNDGDPDRYEAWRGWMATRRINLNARQHMGT